MGTYIEEYDYDEYEHTIEQIVLSDEQGTFFLEAYDDCDDVIWVGRNEDIKNRVSYCLATAMEGYIYGNDSLYEVLVRFTDRYNVSFDFVRQIFRFARNYTAR